MGGRIERIELAQTDVTKDIRDSIELTEKKSDALLATLVLIKETLADIKKNASTIKGGLVNLGKTNTKDLDARTKAQRTANQLAKDAIKAKEIEAKLIRDYEKLEAQREARLKKLADAEAKAHAKREKQYNKEIENANKLGAVYFAESKALNEMRNRYKDLAVQKEKGIKLTRDERNEMRSLLTQINQTDASLKRIDATVGQHQRNVGNYAKALGGVRNIMGQLGIAFGAGAFISNAKDVVVQFDNSIADLSAITGAAGKELDFFKKNAIQMGVDVKGGASAVVEAYKLIASAKPELLENAEALNSVTKSAILLARASGMELPEAATALTDAMNQFGADADQAAKFVDVLAAGAKFGSAEIPQITEALLKFGAVSKTSNVNIQESTALIEDLAEKGLKGADAGTALRNVMLKLSAPDALPKEAQQRLKQLGINFDDLRDKSKPFAERLESLKPLLNDNAALVKVFGTENAVAATTLLSTTDRIKELTAQVDENNVAQEQADARSKTLSEAYNRFKETINGLILEFVDGKNASGGLASALDFLRENIGAIITVAKNAIKVFVIYKTTMTTMAVAQKLFGDGAGKLNISLKQLTSNIKQSANEGKGLGQAFKGIGWTAIIALAAELGVELYHIASGAAQAEENMARLQKTSDRAMKSTAKNIQKITGSLEDQLRIIQNKLTSGEIKSEKEANILRDKAIKLSQKELYQNAQLVKSRRVRYYDLRAEVKEIDKKIKSDQKQGKGVEDQYKRLKEIQKELNIKGDQSIFGEDDATAVDIIAQLNANIKSTLESSAEYYKELKNVTNQSEELDATTTALTKSTDKNTKAKKEQAKAYKDANDQIERMNALLKETQDLTDEIATDEAGRDVQSAIETQLEAIEQTGKYSLDLINDRIQAEYDLRRAIIERQNIEAIDNATNEQEVINARIRRDYEIGKLDEEFLIKRKEANKQLEDAQEQYSERTREKAVETAKKTSEDENKYIELTTKFLEDQIDRRIAKLDEFTEASKKSQEDLRELANNGNIQAQQSIAREAELQREAQVEKQRLERQKAWLQVVSSFLQNYNNKLAEGKKGTQALAEAVTEKAVLESIIKTIPAFKDGGIHKDGGLMLVNDAPGSSFREIIETPKGELYSPEGRNVIMNAPKGTKIHTQDQWTDLQNDMRAKDAFRNANSLGGNVAGNSFDIAPLLKEVKGLKKAISDQPDRWAEFMAITEKSFALHFVSKKGGKTDRIIHQYRKNS